MKTLDWLKKHRIAVLKGGWSRERSISLKTGQAVEDTFKFLGIDVISIDVTRNIESQLKKAKPEFCFIALHGTFGEDGGIQSLLESMKIPYTGSGPMGSSLAMDKNIAKRLFIDTYVTTAPWLLVKKNAPIDSALQWLKKVTLFVKPADQGSAIGTAKVTTPQQLKTALKNCFRVSDRAIVERFVSGRELTVGILGKKALPIVEIIPKHSFYDFHSKYAPGGSRHVTPAKLSKLLTRKIQKEALEAFKAVRCQVYGRVDLVLTKDGMPFVLEVNTIPGMTPTSLLPDAAKAAGLSFEKLVLKICELSLKHRRII